MWPLVLLVPLSAYVVTKAVTIAYKMMSSSGSSLPILRNNVNKFLETAEEYSKFLPRSQKS